MIDIHFLWVREVCVLMEWNFSQLSATSFLGCAFDESWVQQRFATLFFLFEVFVFSESLYIISSLFAADMLQRTWLHLLCKSSAAIASIAKHIQTNTRTHMCMRMCVWIYLEPVEPALGHKIEINWKLRTGCVGSPRTRSSNMALFQLLLLLLLLWSFLSIFLRILDAIIALIYHTISYLWPLYAVNCLAGFFQFVHLLACTTVRWHSVCGWFVDLCSTFLISFN